MEVLRGLLTGGLVLVIQLVAEGGALGVKGGHQILWLVLFQQGLQVVEESMYGRNIHPLLVGQGAIDKSVVGPIDEPVGIEDVQRLVK